MLALLCIMLINLMMKKIYKTLIQTFKLFSDNNATRMSAALSFYTFFSLAPVIIIITFTAKWISGNTNVEAGLYNEIANFAGVDTALKIQEITTNSSNFSLGNLISWIGLFALIFSATGVFTEIQSSINIIWSLKAKPKKSWLKYLINRFLSLSVILGLGFVLLVSLVVSAGIDLVLQKIQAHIPSGTILISAALNIAITVAILSLIFGMIFKFLPDAKVEWKDIRSSSFLTAILFMLGKFLIAYYIGKANPAKNFGATSSVVVILLWVYYSSMILYFGVCFTKVYAQLNNRHIYPDDYAVYVEQIEVQNNATLQEQKETIDIKNTA